MKNNTILIVLLVITVVAGSFFAGMKYQQSRATDYNGQFTGQRNGNRMGGQFTGTNQQSFRPVNGEIISADNKSITVKLTDGSSKIVLFSDKTTINKASEATLDDLKAGEKVAVFGQQNTDGSITAQNIQLNPIAREMMNGGTPRPQ